MEKAFKDLTSKEITLEIVANEADRRAEMIAIHEYQQLLTDLPSALYGIVVRRAIDSVIFGVNTIGRRERGLDGDGQTK